MKLHGSKELFKDAIIATSQLKGIANRNRNFGDIRNIIGKNEKYKMEDKIMTAWYYTLDIKPVNTFES